MNEIHPDGGKARRVAQAGVPGSGVLLVRIPNHALTQEQAYALFSGIDTAAQAPAHHAADGAYLHIVHAENKGETYIYRLGDDAAADVDRYACVRDAACALHPAADMAMLEVIQAVPGASTGESAGWHYVVETDVRPQAEQDFNAWYQNEHLPGLASVPGTVLALRLLNRSGTPRYHALYLLETRETFGSPPWLAVRATDWSSQVRPNFQNTKRTMFTIV